MNRGEIGAGDLMGSRGSGSGRGSDVDNWRKQAPRDKLNKASSRDR